MSWSSVSIPLGRSSYTGSSKYLGFLVGLALPPFVKLYITTIDHGLAWKAVRSILSSAAV